jgi:hypothetical protein
MAYNKNDIKNKEKDEAGRGLLQRLYLTDGRNLTLISALVLVF